MTLGRSSVCDIQLPFDVVSSHHLTIERDGPTYRLRDEGSTNGLKIDGEWVEADTWEAVRDGMVLRIVDVRIEIELEESLTADIDDMTLAQTGTLARELLGDALEGERDELASFEIVEGPSTGRRFELPDDVEGGAIGSDGDAAVPLPSDTVPGTAALVSYTPDGFVVRPSPEATVEHNGTRRDGEAVLSDGDTLRIGAFQLVFVDPLESQLDDIGGLEEGPAPGTTPADEGEANRDSDTDRASESGNTNRWGLLETVLLLATLLFVLLVVLVLLVTFEIV